MLTRRVVITMCLSEGTLVRTKLFRSDRIYTTRFVDLQLADEMCLLNVTRPGGDEDATWQKVREFAGNLFLPMSVGGDVNSIEKARWLMTECGGDKICVNSEAVRRPEFITELGRKIGNQSVVVSIDVKDNATGS